VERLLGAAITDAAVSVRRQVLRALERNAALDPLLAQAEWCAVVSSGASRVCAMFLPGPWQRCSPLPWAVQSVQHLLSGLRAVVSVFMCRVCPLYHLHVERGSTVRTSFLCRQRAAGAGGAERRGCAGAGAGGGFGVGCTIQFEIPLCAGSVRPLLVALNDEDVRVRGLAVDLAGRLGRVNPAVVLPALRRHLMQLLADLEHSPDSRQREGGAQQKLPSFRTFGYVF
jgi:hypothetical protein